MRVVIISRGVALVIDIVVSLFGGGGGIDVIARLIVMAREVQAVFRFVDDDQIAGAEIALQQVDAQGVFDLPLDRAAQGAGAKLWVVALLRQPMARRLRQMNRQAGFVHSLRQFTDLEVNHLLDRFQRQRFKDDDFINSIKEFGAEGIAHRFFDFAVIGDRFLVMRKEAQRAAMTGEFGAEIAGHDQHGVAEIDDVPLAVGHAPVFQHLQQDAPDIRVRLFDFVKEDDAIRAAADRLGQLTAGFVADIAGRRAEEPADRVLLAVLAHVDAHETLFIIKHEFRQRLRQFRFADAARSQEDE